MAWLVNEEHTQAELADRFKRLMTKPEILKIPGAHDAMAALVAKQTGFEALYLSGAAYTASRGLPDLGMITSEEMAVRARDLVRATNLPVLVDIDTGYGGVLNVVRTAREMVEHRVAAVQLEDQDLPKNVAILMAKNWFQQRTWFRKSKRLKKWPRRSSWWRGRTRKRLREPKQPLIVQIAILKQEQTLFFRKPL